MGRPATGQPSRRQRLETAVGSAGPRNRGEALRRCPLPTTALQPGWTRSLLRLMPSAYEDSQTRCSGLGHKGAAVVRVLCSLPNDN